VCAEADVSVSFMSIYGKMQARVLGFTPGNVLLRRQLMSLKLDVPFNWGARIQTIVDFLRHGCVSNGKVSNGMARESFKRASGK